MKSPVEKSSTYSIFFFCALFQKFGLSRVSSTRVSVQIHVCWVVVVWVVGSCDRRRSVLVAAVVVAFAADSLAQAKGEDDTQDLEPNHSHRRTDDNVEVKAHPVLNPVITSLQKRTISHQVGSICSRLFSMSKIGIGLRRKGRPTRSTLYLVEVGIAGRRVVDTGIVLGRE